MNICEHSCGRLLKIYHRLLELSQIIKIVFKRQSAFRITYPSLAIIQFTHANF